MKTASHSDSTATRVIDAATIEFAAYGIAGARMDRIAKEAKTSKERVYAYFRSKDDLYRHVSEAQLAHVADATRLDPYNLPAYAGRLHDYFVENPNARRLARWGALEFGGPDAAAKNIASEKTSALKKAQEQGSLEPSWDPLDILVFVNQLATAWVDQPVISKVSPAGYKQFLQSRRSAIVDAVERIFPATNKPKGAQSTD